VQQAVELLTANEEFVKEKRKLFFGKGNTFNFKAVGRFSQYLQMKGKKDVTPLEVERSKIVKKLNNQMKMKGTDLLA